MDGGFNEPDTYKFLKKLYYNPNGRGGSLGSAKRLYMTIRKYYPEKEISYREVRDFLRSQSSYSVHRISRKKYPVRHYLIGGPKVLYQMDLMDIPSLQEYNSGVRFCLVITDTFSKKLWAAPLPNKKQDTIIGALNFLWTKYSDYPDKIQTDQGGEFSEKVKKFLADKNVVLERLYTDNKASFVERQIRNLKHLISVSYTHLTLPTNREV